MSPACCVRGTLRESSHSRHSTCQAPRTHTQFLSLPSLLRLSRSQTSSAHVPRPAQLSSQLSSQPYAAQPRAAQPCAPCVPRAPRLPAPRFVLVCCTGRHWPNLRLPRPCAGGLAQELVAPRSAVQLSARQRQPGPSLRSQRQLPAFSASVSPFSGSPVSCVGFRVSPRCALPIFASAFPFS